MQNKRLSLTQGFSASVLLAFGAGRFFVAVHDRMLSSIPGLHSLDGMSMPSFLVLTAMHVDKCMRILIK